MATYEELGQAAIAGNEGQVKQIVQAVEEHHRGKVNLGHAFTRSDSNNESSQFEDGRAFGF